MTIIQLKNKFYAIPTCWNELTGKQLIAVTKVMHDEPEEIAGKMMLLKIITGMSTWQWIRQSVIDLEDELHNVDFLLNTSNLTAQLLPVVKHRTSYKLYNFSYNINRTLYGPAGSFDNMTIGEFSFADFYYKEYEKKGAENGIFELNQLVGTLYRSHKPHYNSKINADGDVRMPFNKNLCDAYYPKQVERWPLETKLAVASWFKACRVELQNQFKNVFSGSGGDVAKYGMWSVMNSVAEKGNHGTFTQVENMLLKEFLMDISESIEKNKKLEQKLNNQQ